MKALDELDRSEGIENPFESLIQEKRLTSLQKESPIEELAVTVKPKRKMIWAYLFASFCVLGGCLYSFVWLPVATKHNIDSPLNLIQGLVEGEALVAVADERKPDMPLSMTAKDTVEKAAESLVKVTTSDIIVEAVEMVERPAEVVIPVLETALEIDVVASQAEDDDVIEFDMAVGDVVEAVATENPIEPVQKTPADDKAHSPKQASRAVVKSIKGDLDKLFQ